MNHIALFRPCLLVLLSTALLFSCKPDSSTTINVSEDSPSIEANENTVDLKSREAEREKLKMKAEARLQQAGEKVTPEAVNKMVDEMMSEVKSERLPNACDLISDSKVAAIFDKAEADVSSAAGKRSQSGVKNSSSCFYRWKAGGILVQISKNPLPSEIKDWSTKYITTKKVSGETSINESGETTKHMYVDFNGPGKHNVYNEDNSRYFSTYNERYIISVNFNGNNRREKSIAVEVMNEIFSNLKDYN